MMSEPLENLYFNWLCAKVHHVENPTPSLAYWKLLRAFHNTEFVWTLSGDDNRSEDGVELRIEFLNASWLELTVETAYFAGAPCSMLEMLIAFSRRAEFMTLESAKDWFWEFIRNLGLEDQNDANFVEPSVMSTIDNLVWRTYDSTGRGGLFPMDDPPEDQRKVEIWYQFCEYLIDQGRTL